MTNMNAEYTISSKMLRLPVFDQPVGLSLLLAVAHDQHSVVHVVGTCVVSVNACEVKDQELNTNPNSGIRTPFTQVS